MWIQRLKRLKWQEDKEAPNKGEFSPEQLHRSWLTIEAASPQPQEHSSRGVVTPPPRHVAEGVSSLNEDWIGGPWKSLPALRFCNSMASKLLQREALNQVVVTMGANGFQGEASSVWVE